MNGTAPVLASLTLLGFLVAAPAGLSGWWPLEEGSGQQTGDSMSNHPSAKIIGAAEWGPGKAGKGLRFDGKSALEVPSSSALQLGNSFSVTLWFSSSRAGHSNKPASILLSRQRGEGRGPGVELLVTRDGYLAAGVRGATNGIELTPSGRKILDGQWHHLAAVFTASRVVLLVDGLTNSEASGSWTALPFEAPLRIGGRDDKFPGFFGQIDEVKLWKRVLTRDEVIADIKAGGGLPNIAANWKNRDTGRPLVGNQIQNGSFEVGTDHWFADFDSPLSPSNASETTGLPDPRASFSAPESNGFPTGRRALRIQIDDRSDVHLTSELFPLRFGYPASLSFHANAPAAGRRFEVRVGYDRNEAHQAVRQVFKVEKEGWQRYVLSFTPPQASSRGYFVEWMSADAGTWWLDGFAATEGEHVAVYAPNPVHVGVESADGNHPANLYYRDELVRLNVLAESRPGPAFMNLYGRVLNAWGDTTSRFDLTVPLSKEGFGKAGFMLSAAHQGGFKCELFTNARFDGPPHSEFIYSVIPRLKPPSDQGDSFFGGHVELTPWNLDLARRVGFRWLRLSGAADTKWPRVERENGRFDFDTSGVARAVDRGFQVLGTLDGTPTFHAESDGKRTRHGESAWQAPRDMSAWRRYVSNTCAAFDKYIHDWELGNEPDVNLVAPSGKTREQIYLDLVTNTRQVFDASFSNQVLVAGAVASLKNGFFMEILTNGLASNVDGVSFHFRFEDRSPDEAPAPSALQTLVKVAEFPDRRGKPLPVWHTEGGPWHGEGSSWLRAARLPSSSGLNMADVAGALVRTMAALKANGVTRHFQYHCFAQASGGRVYRDDSSVMVDRDGSALPAFVAHAVAVSFLDTADGRGVEELSAGDSKISLARFLRSGRAIDVAWSRVPVRLKNATTLRWQDREAFDIMGNPLALTPEYRLTQSPIYLRTPMSK